MTPPVTVCVLTYGDYPELATRCIGSIISNCDRHQYGLVVGANAIGRHTSVFLNELLTNGSIDALHQSETNINKCPMMRQMFQDIDTEFIWWFDDDSHIVDPQALSQRLAMAEAAPPSTVMWGHQFLFGHEKDFSYGTDVVGFVRSAPWYRGRNPPSWEWGGKGEYNFEGRGCGDGRWFFITGGCWFIRASVIRALDWPDRRMIKRNDDVFLCEAIRQQGWHVADIGPLGIMINDAARRGSGEDFASMQHQMSAPPFQPSGWFSGEEAQIYRSLVQQIRGGIIVEVGVWQGRSLQAILDVCRDNNNRVFAIDNWNPPADDPDYAEARDTDIYAIFLQNLERLGHIATVEVICDNSARAAARFADRSVDLLFLDADHNYEAVKRDIQAWLPKMKDRGCLCGHDYTFREGVRHAVHEIFHDRVELLGGSIWRARTEQPLRSGRGCVFIPTFRDSTRLYENFHGRSDLLAGLDKFVYDDNFEADENELVRSFCERNGFTYHLRERSRHGSWEDEQGDLSGYNKFIWTAICELGLAYDYVIKLDTDTLLLDATWYHEISQILLTNPGTIAGTPETRPVNDVASFWMLAEHAGYNFARTQHITHMQGGLYGLGRAAIDSLRKMGFLEGRHVFFAEDCYISYCCHLCGVSFHPLMSVGSWFRAYRPKLATIDYLKAIHPLMRSEWDAFVRSRVAPLEV
jgi:predicted O-methyltransferase YrrM